MHILLQIRNGYSSSVANHLKRFFSKLNMPDTGNKIVSKTDSPFTFKELKLNREPQKLIFENHSKLSYKWIHCTQKCLKRLTKAWISDLK